MTDRNKKYCGTCENPCFERNHYYYGKLMTARDLYDEQCYFNEKRWLINRMVLGWGVVCGLDVRRMPVDPEDPTKGYDDKNVLVTPGLAIDCCGREILVCEERKVELIPEESTCCTEHTEQEEKKFIICLEFYECKTEQINIPSISCNSKEKYGFNRIRDSYKIRIIDPSSEDNEKVHKRICPLEYKSEYLFDWDNIPGNDSDRLIEFLKKNYNVEWVSAENINKTNDTIEISNGTKSLSLKLVNERVYLTINDGRTDELIVKMKGETRNIYRIETVNGYLCKKIKEGCPECSEPLCLVLAEITFNPSVDPPIRIDNCSKRKLVYRNPLLYGMIDCYHGDLPHIIGINWKENGANISWEDFTAENGIYSKGVQVEFDWKMNKDTINPYTFLLFVKMEDADTGNFVYEQVPGEVDYDENTSIATFSVTSKWLMDVFFGYSRIREKGGEFMVVLKSDFITSYEENGKPAKALDGNFIGGKLPSGNGTQGGDFVSWFSVESKPEGETAQRRVR